MEQKEEKKEVKVKKRRSFFFERIPFMLPLILLASAFGGWYFTTSLGLDLRYFIIIIGFVLSFYVLLKTGKFKWFVLCIFLFMFVSNVFTSTGVLMLSAGEYGTTYHSSQQQLYCTRENGFTATWIGGDLVTVGELDSYTIKITGSAQWFRHGAVGSGQMSMVIVYIESGQEQFYYNVYTTQDDQSLMEINTLYKVEKGKTITIRIQIWSQDVADVYTPTFVVELSYVTTDPQQQNTAFGSAISGDFGAIISSILGAFSSFESFFNFIIYILPAIIIGIGIFYLTIGRDPYGGTKTILFGAMMYGGALVVNIMVGILGYNPFDYLNIAGTQLNITFGMGLQMSMSGNTGVNILVFAGDFFIMAFFAFIIAWLVIDGVRITNWIRKFLSRKWI